jgi:integrase
MLLQRCDSPLLLVATRCAIVLAEARGWSAATLTGVFYGLKAVLDGHTGDGPVPLSRVRQRARPRSHSSATRIAEVLAELGLLHDDTTAAIRAWIDHRAGELPAGFGRDVRAWLVVLLDGDARSRPRSHVTVRVHFGMVRPFIECWAATRSHLRGITSGDVDTVLEPLRGHRRYNAIMALRSLFQFARRHGLTFADPTRHLRGGRGAGRTMLPMTAEQIRAVEQAAVTPAQRLAITLAAVHAARPKAIRELTLDDIDLPSRRITLAGHRQRLGELTRHALLGWLRYRRVTWPDTANRHVLVSRISALGSEPVSADFLDKHQLRGISLERIRRDRILQEALATGGDPLHLALVFNIDHTNAMAYANAARNLLSSPAEQAPSPAPGRRVDSGHRSPRVSRLAT